MAQIIRFRIKDLENSMNDVEDQQENVLKHIAELKKVNDALVTFLGICAATLYIGVSVFFYHAGLYQIALNVLVVLIVGVICWFIADAYDKRKVL